MREDSPSTTAAAVAFARGLAKTAGADGARLPDPVAAELLSPALGRLLGVLGRAVGSSRALALAARVGSAGLVDHVALRTLAIDEALLEATRRGTRQVVLLGAGLDARAFRLDALREAVVYEIDHPATQRAKRTRLEGLAATAREVRFVPVDFEREGLADRLGEAGHDPAQPTFWIWEGVTMYLQPEAVRSTLRQIQSRSAPPSRLAATYLVAREGLWLSRAPHAVIQAFRLLGEPLVGITDRERFRATVEEAGFAVEGDAGPREWSARYGFGAPAFFTIEERLVVAEVRP